MSGRIGASFAPTSCEFPFYPGTIGELERYFEVIGPFMRRNYDTTAADDVCVRVTVDPGTCKTNNGRNALVHVTAFTQFNPLQQGIGYLGDIGDPDDFSEFSFIFPGDQESFVIVGQQIRDIQAEDNGAGCVFSVVVQFGNGICDDLTRRPSPPTPPPSPEPTVAPTTASPTVTPVPTAVGLPLCEWVDSSPFGSTGTFF